LQEFSKTFNMSQCFSAENTFRAIPEAKSVSTCFHAISGYWREALTLGKKIKPI